MLKAWSKVWKIILSAFMVLGVISVTAQDHFEIVEAANGDPTVKVGMMINVIDQDGNPIEGVTFQVQMNATYGGSYSFNVGPSDEYGIARSASDAVQLYEYNGSSAPRNVFSNAGFTPSITIKATSWPEGYTQPTFVMPDLDGFNKKAEYIEALGIFFDSEGNATNSSITYASRTNKLLYPVIGSAGGNYMDDMTGSSAGSYRPYVPQDELSGGEYFSAIGFNLRDDPYGDKTGQVYAPVVFRTVGQEYVDLELTKKDVDTQELLEGVVFQVINKTGGAGDTLRLKDGTEVAYGGVVAEATTDANGFVAFRDLPKQGMYTIHEKEPKAGYTRIEDFTFEPNAEEPTREAVPASETEEAQNAAYEKTINNEKMHYVDLTIDKKDLKTDAPLEGVVFELVNNSGEAITLQDGTSVENEAVIAELTTLADGKVTYSGLPKTGKYLLREKETLTGYILIKDPIAFDPSTETPTQEETATTNAVYEKAITNEQIEYVEIEIKKTDKDTGALLEGVEFTVSNGNSFPITLQDGTVVNSYGVIGTITTDENGIASITGLPKTEGSRTRLAYSIKETSTIDGYALNQSTYYVYSDSHGTIRPATETTEAVYEVEIKNEKYTWGDLRITKVDEDNHDIPVVGAVFKLNNYSSFAITLEDGTVVEQYGEIGTYTTDENGQFIVEGLPTITGVRYRLEELSTPVEYVNTYKGGTYISLSDLIPNDVADKMLTNKKFEVTYFGYKLTKRGRSNGISSDLQGAKFALVNANDRDVTDKNGNTFGPGEVIYELDMTNSSEGTIEQILPRQFEDQTPVMYHVYETVVPDGYTGENVSGVTKLPGWEEYPLVNNIDGSTVTGSHKTTTVDNYVPFEIQIIKKDFDDVPLPGAEFKIVFYASSFENDTIVVEGTTYQIGDTILEGLVTDTEGRIKTGQILPVTSQKGSQITYEIVETKAPNGYMALSGSRYYQPIHSTAGTTLNYNIANSKIKYGAIKIHKRDYYGVDGPEPLEGIEFQIILDTAYEVDIVDKDGNQYNKGDVVATITTDENGNAETGFILPVTSQNGTIYSTRYIVREVTPPEGYRKAYDSTVIFENGNLESVRELTINNDRDSGFLAISKYNFPLLEVTEDTSEEFEYDITLKDADGNPVNESYYYRVNDHGSEVVKLHRDREYEGEKKVTFVDGKATLSIPLSGFLVIHDIPSGYTYQVEEKEKEGWIILDHATQEDQEIYDRYSWDPSYRISSRWTNMKDSFLVDVEATKVLEQETLSEGQFTFELKDENGTVVGTATNDANGTIKFEKVSLPFSALTINTLNIADATEEQYQNMKYWYAKSAGYLEVSTKDIPDDAFTEEYVDGQPVKIYYKDADPEERDNESWWEYEQVEGNQRVSIFNGNADDIKETAERYHEELVAYLVEGEYTLTINEVIPENTDGYVYDEHIETVTIKVSGELGTDLNIEYVYDADKATFTNTKKTIVEVSKVEVGGTSELPGAKLQITSDVKDFEPIEWTSTSESMIVSLAPGKYTLKELSAPEGYEVASPISFEVTNEGLVLVNGNEVDKVVMEDAKKSEKPTPTPSITPGPTPKPTVTPTPKTPTPNRVTVPYTDASDTIGVYLGLFLIGLLGVFYSMLRLRKQ